MNFIDKAFEALLRGESIISAIDVLNRQCGVYFWQADI